MERDIRWPIENEKTADWSQDKEQSRYSPLESTKIKILNVIIAQKTYKNMDQCFSPMQKAYTVSYQHTVIIFLK